MWSARLLGVPRMELKVVIQLPLNQWVSLQQKQQLS